MAPRLSLAVVALLGIVALNACSDAPTQLAPASAPSLKKASVGTGEFMILGSEGILPADIGALVEAAGGTIVRDYPELGLAVARATRTGFAARAAAIAGVESVTEDRVFDFTDPNMRVMELTGIDEAPTEEVASTADNDQLYPIQWAPAAINAPEAWNLGYRGRGVRVAILDGGLHSTHPDLRDNVDVAASTSFVPGFAFNTDVGTFWHGTHVAGIVAAVDNAQGGIGIAPSATLIGVKVLHNGVGTFGALIAGVLYAATPRPNGAGAQVINMSVGALIRDAKAKEEKKDIKELTKALDRAMSYAWKSGVTVVAAAGNDTLNLDDEKTAISIPAQSAHVISVGATGPIGWALGNRDFERLAAYSNWGKSLLDLSAPGGDSALPGNAVCAVPINATQAVVNFCWVFDMYLSTSRGSATSAGGYSWAAGTSMASPVTAGIVALIIGKAGGNISPAEVAEELRRGAVDHGQPGNDAVYGHGWVNALGSVR